MKDCQHSDLDPVELLQSQLKLNPVTLPIAVSFACNLENSFAPIYLMPFIGYFQDRN